MAAGLERVACAFAADELEPRMVGVLGNLLQYSRCPGQPATRRSGVAEPNLVLMGDPQCHVRSSGLIPATVIAGVRLSPRRDRQGRSFDPPQGAT